MPHGFDDATTLPGKAFFEEHVQQPVLKKGDVVLFSEATIHGAVTWKADFERRVALYRFAPANFAYGRMYLGEETKGPFGLDLKELTEEEKAVLLPPYAVRTERMCVEVDKEEGGRRGVKVGFDKRTAEKKEHDFKVFGTKWF